ncbi:DNA-directed RNA polymerase specialized sigma24 family protein [Siphonobacter sp. SORGH_AS 1065]|nr:DNA-directed RNA polymerase specialized sigma24 family protein [Siphonobacter sp. SORGH_AS_1065]
MVSSMYLKPSDGLSKELRMYRGLFLGRAFQSIPISEEKATVFADWLSNNRLEQNRLSELSIDYALIWTRADEALVQATITVEERMEWLQKLEQRFQEKTILLAKEKTQEALLRFPNDTQLEQLVAILKLNDYTQLRKELGLIRRQYNAAIEEFIKLVYYKFYRHVSNNSPVDIRDDTDTLLTKVLHKFMDAIERGSYQGPEKATILVYIHPMMVHGWIDILRTRKPTGDFPELTEESVDDTKAFVEDALKQLGQPCQSIIIERDIHGCSWEEVAERTSISKGHAKNSYRGCQEQLRSILVQRGW